MDENGISIMMSKGMKKKLIMSGMRAQTTTHDRKAMPEFATETVREMFMKDSYRDGQIFPAGFENFMHKLGGQPEKVKHTRWHRLTESVNGTSHLKIMAYPLASNGLILEKDVSYPLFDDAISGAAFEIIDNRWKEIAL